MRIELSTDKQMFYKIEVEGFHNFYVSASEVLAHNMVLVLAAPVAAPVISCAVVVTAVKTAAAVSFVAGCFYSLFWSSDSKSKQKKDACSGGG